MIPDPHESLLIFTPLIFGCIHSIALCRSVNVAHSHSSPDLSVPAQCKHANTLGNGVC